MRAVPSGSYWLRAGYDVDGNSFSGRVPLEVRDSNIEGIEFTLQPPLNVAGQVVIEGAAGAKRRRNERRFPGEK